MKVFDTLLHELSNSFVELDGHVLVPNYSLVCNDTINFCGRKIPYEDFTRFWIKDGSLHAVWKEDCEGAAKVDLFHAINAGLASQLQGCCPTSLYRNFFKELASEVRPTSKLSILKNLEDIQVKLADPKVASMMGIRYIFDPFDVNMICDITALLDYLYFTDKKVYVTTLVEFIFTIYVYYVEFCVVDSYASDKAMLASHIVDYLKDHQNDWRSHSHSFISRDETFTVKDLGELFLMPIVLEYFDDNKTDLVCTNGDKVAQFSFVLFLSELLSCVEFKEGQPRFDPSGDYQFVCEKYFETLGDDPEGDYYRTGKATFDPQKIDQTLLDSGINFGSNESLCLKGETINRTVAENHCTVCGGWVESKECTGPIVTLQSHGMDTRYTNYSRLVSVALRLGEYRTPMIGKQEFAEVAKEFHYLSPDAYRSDLSSELAKIRQQSDSLHTENKDLKADVKRLTNENAELHRILERRDEAITRISEECDHLKRVVGNLFDDSVTIDEDGVSDKQLDSSVDVPMDEKIDFIKSFRICVVGGRSDFSSKLYEYGISVKVIENVADAEFKRDAVDFICFATKFISHKLVRLVESKFPGLTDCMYYYSGTNVEKFIDASYSFIHNWVERK